MLLSIITVLLTVTATACGKQISRQMPAPEGTPIPAKNPAGPDDTSAPSAHTDTPDTPNRQSQPDVQSQITLKEAKTPLLPTQA